MHCLCVNTIFDCCRAISHWIIKIWNILKMGKWQLEFVRQDSLGWRAVLPTDCRVLVKQITLCRCLEMHCLCFGTIFHCWRAISHWIIKIWNIWRAAKGNWDLWDRILLVEELFCQPTAGCWRSRVTFSMPCNTITLVGTIFHCYRAISHWIKKIWNILKIQTTGICETGFSWLKGCSAHRLQGVDEAESPFWCLAMHCLCVGTIFHCCWAISHWIIKIWYILKRGKRQLGFVRHDSLSWRAVLPTDCRVLVKQSPHFDALQYTVSVLAQFFTVAGQSAIEL